MICGARFSVVLSRHWSLYISGACLGRDYRLALVTRDPQWWRKDEMLTLRLLPLAFWVAVWLALA